MDKPLSVISQLAHEHYEEKAFERIKIELSALNRSDLNTREGRYIFARKFLIVGELCSELLEDGRFAKQKYSPSFIKILELCRALRNTVYKSGYHQIIHGFQKVDGDIVANANKSIQEISFLCSTLVNFKILTQDQKDLSAEQAAESFDKIISPLILYLKNLLELFTNQEQETPIEKEEDQQDLSNLDKPSRRLRSILNIINNAIKVYNTINGIKYKEKSNAESQLTKKRAQEELGKLATSYKKFITGEGVKQHIINKLGWEKLPFIELKLKYENNLKETAASLEKYQQRSEKDENILVTTFKKYIDDSLKLISIIKENPGTGSSIGCASEQEQEIEQAKLRLQELEEKFKSSLNAISEAEKEKLNQLGIPDTLKDQTRLEIFRKNCDQFLKPAEDEQRDKDLPVIKKEKKTKAPQLTEEESKKKYATKLREYEHELCYLKDISIREGGNELEKENKKYIVGFSMALLGELARQIQNHIEHQKTEKYSSHTSKDALYIAMLIRNFGLAHDMIPDYINKIYDNRDSKILPATIDIQAINLLYQYDFGAGQQDINTLSIIGYAFIRLGKYDMAVEVLQKCYKKLEDESVLVPSNYDEIATPTNETERHALDLYKHLSESCPEEIFNQMVQKMLRIRYEIYVLNEILTCCILESNFLSAIETADKLIEIAQNLHENITRFPIPKLSGALDYINSRLIYGKTRKIFAFQKLGRKVEAHRLLEELALDFENGMFDKSKHAFELSKIYKNLMIYESDKREYYLGKIKNLSNYLDKPQEIILRLSTLLIEFDATLLTEKSIQVFNQLRDYFQSNKAELQGALGDSVFDYEMQVKLRELSVSRMEIFLFCHANKNLHEMQQRVEIKEDSLLQQMEDLLPKVQATHLKTLFLKEKIKRTASNFKELTFKQAIEQFYQINKNILSAEQIKRKISKYLSQIEDPISFKYTDVYTFEDHAFEVLSKHTKHKDEQQYAVRDNMYQTISDTVSEPQKAIKVNTGNQSSSSEGSLQVKQRLLNAFKIQKSNIQNTSTFWLELIIEGIEQEQLKVYCKTVLNFNESLFYVQPINGSRLKLAFHKKLLEAFQNLE